MLLALIPSHDSSTVAGHVAELDDAAVCECDSVFRLVVPVQALWKDRQDRVNDGVLHVAVLTTDDQNFDARIIQSQQAAFPLCGPGLAAASGSAVTDVPLLRKKVIPLRF